MLQQFPSVVVCFFPGFALFSYVSLIKKEKKNAACVTAGLDFLVLSPPKLQYKSGVGQGTSVSETPEMERVKRNQLNISTVLCQSGPPLVTRCAVEPFSSTSLLISIRHTPPHNSSPEPSSPVVLMFNKRFSHPPPPRRHNTG